MIYPLLPHENAVNAIYIKDENQGNSPHGIQRRQINRIKANPSK